MPKKKQPKEKKRDMRSECVALSGDGDLLFMDDFDDALIGVADRFGMETVAAYDFEKVIELLMAQGMSHDDAVEFHSFNQIGAWMGDKTPLFIRRI